MVSRTSFECVIVIVAVIAVVNVAVAVVVAEQRTNVYGVDYRLRVLSP